MSGAVAVELSAVIVAVTDEEPRVLTVSTNAHSAPGFPCGPLEPAADATLELGLRRWVRQQTGLDLAYVEQLYTFGDRNRQASGSKPEQRMLSVAYLALVREGPGSEGLATHWRGIYEFLPWEDWRDGRPTILDRRMIPELRRWVDTTRRSESRRAREDRLEITFGRRGAPWDGERVLDRYELLWEAGCCAEAGAPKQRRFGSQLALDHRRILATAVGRLRGKLRYRPVVFELVAPTFTLLQLQRTVEALAGVRLHKQNFRRLLERGGLVEGTGRIDSNTGGRPAELFRFRRDVLRERPAPGVGLPGLKAF